MGPLPDAAQLSVVIVNYHSYGELQTCLSSLERAAIPMRIIVVDNAGDADAADALSRAFPHVDVIRVPRNEGFAAGVNRGAQRAIGPFVLLLNPDCTVEPSTCAILAEWMRAHPNVGALGPRVLNADGSIQPTARRFPDFTTAIAGRSSWLTRVLPGNPLSRWNLPGRINGNGPRDVDWVSGACMLVRREAFDQLGGLDEGFFLYWEDADFCRRLKQAGWRTVYLPHTVATHLGGRSSRHSADASLEAFHRSAFRLYWKHSTVGGRLLAPVVFGALRLRLAFLKRLVRRRSRMERADVATTW